MGPVVLVAPAVLVVPAVQAELSFLQQRTKSTATVSFYVTEKQLRVVATAIMAGMAQMAMRVRPAERRVKPVTVGTADW
ncbi:MAG: hypothetical protein B7W97_01850 [Mycobacterium sp. 20-66-4]|nr:MAG: hypothetical protein B7W97_01850 [Mycobacterium sp. 20-66-4]